MKEEKTNAIRILEKTKISFEAINYEPDENIDAISVAAKLGEDASVVYKTLITQGKTRQYYVFVIPADAELDLKAAARAVGEKSVEMIPVKEINAVSGYIRGGCSPVGMKKQFKTVIDKSAETLPLFFVSGGRRGTQLKLCPKELSKLIGAGFSDIVL
ncbi:MAG: Cys-tRNA(Pro) deacylase [Eubacteriales bacterium]|nr:Cys-tRNA(Pro) deacylase [Eubacteriales bacterium]MDD3881640.1 Cys-tRNA(Pro) deacylase [Eubacteriales bacterium]MDD4512301.1 Cys-tRNA(Pro) deacylase [Eubacteriales bacterium]